MFVLFGYRLSPMSYGQVVTPLVNYSEVMMSEMWNVSTNPAGVQITCGPPLKLLSPGLSKPAGCRIKAGRLCVKFVFKMSPARDSFVSIWKALVVTAMTVMMESVYIIFIIPTTSIYIIYIFWVVGMKWRDCFLSLNNLSKYTTILYIFMAGLAGLAGLAVLPWRTSMQYKQDPTITK